MTRSRSRKRLATAEAWWPLIARVLSFLLGAAVVVWQTVLEESDRTILLLVAVGLMGLLPLSVIASVLDRRRDDER